MSTSISETKHPGSKAPESLRGALEQRAAAFGFDAIRVTTPDAIEYAAHGLRAYLDAGHHGTMDWMARDAERRASPCSLWPDARSIVMFGMNYGPDRDPLEDLSARHKGLISVYARGDDYHDLIKGRLKQIANWFARETGSEVKVFVDTAPVMEKPLAASAGIGWQGKHTNLVSRDFGSWLFLGAMFTAHDLSPDDAEQDHCGTCRACLDICPTDAFPAPYKLDARRCISYLTIEHKGHIAREFRKPMGNRIYGCDDCLAVCPWNKFAQEANEARLQAREATLLPALEELAALDDAAFRRRFRKSPVKRTGRDRFVRNVMIAIGNSGDPGLMQSVRTCLEDDSPLVRGMAVWALGQLGTGAERHDRSQSYLPRETDVHVRAEWSLMTKEDMR